MHFGLETRRRSDALNDQTFTKPSHHVQIQINRHAIGQRLGTGSGTVGVGDRQPRVRISGIKHHRVRVIARQRWKQ